jgi:F-type H+-transporting ATPase subunit gamma
MAKTREIKLRIKAVANIRRITKTMQMIATAKFAAALQRATATKPYTEGIFELVQELGATAGNISSPLIDGAPGSASKPELLLVITSDRGLCGAYNGNILRNAMKHIRAVKAAGKALDVELVGKKGVAFFRYNNIPVTKAYSLGDKPAFEEIERIAQDYMDRFSAGEFSAVRVAFMRYYSAGKQAPDVLQLLPLKSPAGKDAPAKTGPAAQYEFTPSAEELLAELLPQAVKTTLFQSMNDALVSEHIGRMVAMKAATDNAGKMGKALTRKFNRARQAQITTELTEIISGAAALE